MKRFFLLMVFAVSSMFLAAQTNGTLDVSVSTSSTGGNYAPRNIVAIWIEDPSGNFVKTLLAYADKRIKHLNTWESSTNAKNIMYNRTDAITGATQSSHGTRTCSWNGTDYNKNLVADGQYNVCMELTDKNSTGNYSKFEFTKGETNTITPANVPSFSSVNIHWEASGTVDAKQIEVKDDIVIFPNPGKTIFTVRGKNINEIEILDISGSVIFKNRSTKTIDMSAFSDGIYLVKFETNSGTIVKKLLKDD